MTEGAQFVTGGLFLAAAYVAMFADYVETVKALDKGAKEVGFLASKVVAKWGAKALPLFTFLSAVGVTVLAAVFGTMGGEYLMAYSIPLFAALAVNDIRNLITLRKMK